MKAVKSAGARVAAGGIVVALLLCGSPFGGRVEAQPKPQPLKIGVVEMNRALNMSKAGQRSKSILLAAKSQKELELKNQEQEVKRLQDELDNNIMLSKEAREQRESQLRDRQRDLRTAVQDAQRQLQEQERKLTDSVISELTTIVGIIAREENFDFVLEQGASQVVLYSRIKFIDFTDKVIERYDNLQGAK